MHLELQQAAVNLLTKRVSNEKVSVILTVPLSSCVIFYIVVSATEGAKEGTTIRKMGVFQSYPVLHTPHDPRSLYSTFSPRHKHQCWINGGAT